MNQYILTRGKRENLTSQNKSQILIALLHTILTEKRQAVAVKLRQELPDFCHKRQIIFKCAIQLLKVQYTY